jgi:beta-glucosidase
VSVDVTNTGVRAGAEVVQVYVRDVVSSVTRPVKELKAFEKVWLEPSETKTLTLSLGSGAFAFHDVGMHYVVEPGEFTIMVGTSSVDLVNLTLHVTPAS